MVKESYKKRCEEFCGICGNVPQEHQPACKEVNEGFRRKYVMDGSCNHAVINGVPVSILTGDKILVELDDEWYARNDSEKIEYALNEKRERLERERLE